jgi:hypothetical protein
MRPDPFEFPRYGGRQRMRRVAKIANVSRFFVDARFLIDTIPAVDAISFNRESYLSGNQCCGSKNESTKMNPEQTIKIDQVSYFMRKKGSKCFRFNCSVLRVLQVLLFCSRHLGVSFLLRDRFASNLERFVAVRIPALVRRAR